MRKKFAGKKGFTLFEALISITLFVIVGSLASTAYVYNVRNYKYIKVEKELTDDAQFIFEKISKDIEGSTIDYEEYYNHEVLKEADYRINYGKYAGRFYNNDVNTGQNPALSDIFAENAALRSAATCDPHCAVGGCDMSGCFTASAGSDPWKFDELYLISGDGKYKTVFRYDPVAGTLGYLKMEGRDTNNDDVYGTYSYMSGFENAAFVSISPPRSKISDLRFYVSPLEDPRKAFAETDSSVQLQPHVTIYLELEPALDNLSGLGTENIPSLATQTTLSAHVYHEVLSYPAE